MVIMKLLSAATVPLTVNVLALQINILKECDLKGCTVECWILDGSGTMRCSVAFNPTVVRMPWLRRLDSWHLQTHSEHKPLLMKLHTRRDPCHAVLCVVSYLTAILVRMIVIASRGVIFSLLRILEKRIFWNGSHQVLTCNCLSHSRVVLISDHFMQG